jgi:hypothetical protein
VLIKNGEIFNDIKPAIGKLIQVQLPVRTAFEVARFTALIEPHIKTIENVKNSLIIQYGKIDERTATPIIDPECENWEQFVNEYNALMEIEVELPDTKISIPSTVNGMDVKIEASVLLQLEKFVELA